MRLLLFLKNDESEFFQLRLSGSKIKQNAVIIIFFLNSMRSIARRISLKDGVYTAQTRCRRWRWSGDRACIYTRPQWWWPRNVNRLGKAPRWCTRVSTAPFTFLLTSCASHRRLSPDSRISDFQELATSRDEYKRFVGETELPVTITVCAVSVVGACGSNLGCLFLGYTSLSQRHLGHYLYVDHGGVRPTLYLPVSHLHQILAPRDVTIWNSICTSPPLIYKDRIYAAKQDVSSCCAMWLCCYTHIRPRHANIPSA